MKRLNAIMNFIDEKDIVADIGCDHGYLLKLAIENKNIIKGYAIDNKNGPLDSAKNNLSCYNNVDFMLSDGLKSVDKEDINCVVIAGMGGMLINSIISDSIEKFKKMNKIILCPNRNVGNVRLFLILNGFKITNETIICEDEKYYEILVAEVGEQSLTSDEIFFGPFLLKEKSEVFINKWKDYYNRIKYIPSKTDEINALKEVLNER